MSRHQIYRNSCVACGSQDVAITCLIDAEQQDPKIRSHTVLVECKKCYRAQVEKLEYDAYDWAQATDRYAWYVLDFHDKSRLAGMIERCPHPFWAACDWSIHNALRSTCTALPVPRAKPADSSWHIYRVRLERDEPLPKLTLLESGRHPPPSGSTLPTLPDVIRLCFLQPMLTEIGDFEFSLVRPDGAKSVLAFSWPDDGMSLDIRIPHLPTMPQGEYFFEWSVTPVSGGAPVSAWIATCVIRLCMLTGT